MTLQAAFIRPWQTVARVGIRYTHRSSSAVYAKIWANQGADYKEAMAFVDCTHRFDCPRTDLLPHDFPKLCERVFRVESIMKRSGYVPFVHARPHYIAAAMAVEKRLMKNTNPLYEPFRPLSNFMDADLAQKKVQAMLNRGKGDWDPELRELVIAASPALTSSMSVADSAAYHWLWLNARADIKKVAETSLFKSFAERGYNDIERRVTTFSKTLWGLCKSLPVSNLLVVGSSPHYLKHFYNCRSFGRPVHGETVEDNVQHPERSKRLKWGHQVRLIVSRQTMFPSSQFPIVNIETDSYNHAIRKALFKPAHAVKALQPIVMAQTTPVEEHYLAQLGAAQKRIQEVVDEITNH